MVVTANCTNQGKDFTHKCDSTAGLHLVDFDNQSCHLHEQQRSENKALHSSVSGTGGDRQAFLYHMDEDWLSKANTLSPFCD
jgi:hypothetical protein